MERRWKIARTYHGIIVSVLYAHLSQWIAEYLYRDILATETFTDGFYVEMIAE